MCVEVAPIAIPVFLVCEHPLSDEFAHSIQGGAQEPARVVSDIDNKATRA